MNVTLVVFVRVGVAPIDTASEWTRTGSAGRRLWRGAARAFITGCEREQ